MSDTATAKIATPFMTIDNISIDGLLVRVDALRNAGWRIVQVMAISTSEAVELNYSFGLDREMRVLRLIVAPGVAIPSITPVYAGAYLYENEIRDLFGVMIERISVDWLGKVYDVAKELPFSKLSIAIPSVEGGGR